MCRCNDGGGGTPVSAVGGPANPCGTYFDECAPSAATSPCGAAQTCADPAKTVSSQGDYTCTCDNYNGQNFGAAVADCSTLSSVPTPPPAQKYWRFLFRVRSRIARARYTLDRVVGAIVRAINLLSNGQDDPLVTNVGKCMKYNVRQVCWRWREDGETCGGGALTELRRRRGHVAQQQEEVTSDGEFELLTLDQSGQLDNTKRNVWIEALQRSESELLNDPDIAVEPGSVVLEKTYGAETPAPPLTNVEDEEEDDSSSAWWVIFLIVLFIVIIIILLLLLLCLKKKKDREQKELQEKLDKEQAQKEQPQGGEGAAVVSEDGLLTDEQPADDPAAAGANGARGGGGSGDAPGAGNPIDDVFPAGAGKGAYAAGSGGAAPSAGDPDASPACARSPQQDTHVYCWGRNLEGQLGLGDMEDMRTLATAEELPELAGRGVSMMCCGSFHTVIVCTDATVLVFGEGGDGQLGLGGTASPKTPTPNPFFQLPRKPRMVSCGEQHTMIACDDGVWAFGRGEDGQLGLGDTADRLSPERVSLFGAHGDSVADLACGSHHTCAVYSGALYSWGWNRYGQLGLGDDTDRTVPARVRFFDQREIHAIACGVQHTVVLCGDGVYAFGGNTYGQLGLGHQTNQATPQRIPFFDARRVEGVSAWFHTCVWCDGEGLFAFGEGMHGKLGTDPGCEDDVPPNRADPAPVPHFAGQPVLAACAGSEHTLVLTEEGLHMWGNGDGGKLGHGDFELVTDPALSRVAALDGVVVHATGVGVDHTLVYAEPR